MPAAPPPWMLQRPGSSSASKDTAAGGGGAAASRGSRWATRATGWWWERERLYGATREAPNDPRRCETCGKGLLGKLAVAAADGSPYCDEDCAREAGALINLRELDLRPREPAVRKQLSEAERRAAAAGTRAVPLAEGLECAVCSDLTAAGSTGFYCTHMQHVFCRDCFGVCGGLELLKRCPLCPREKWECFGKPREPASYGLVGDAQLLTRESITDEDRAIIAAWMGYATRTLVQDGLFDRNERWGVNSWWDRKTQPGPENHGHGRPLVPGEHARALIERLEKVLPTNKDIRSDFPFEDVGVVSNGGGLLHLGCGELIDEHPCVMRFNNTSLALAKRQGSDQGTKGHLQFHTFSFPHQFLDGVTSYKDVPLNVWTPALLEPAFWWTPYGTYAEILDNPVVAEGCDPDCHPSKKVWVLRPSFFECHMESHLQYQCSTGMFGLLFAMSCPGMPCAYGFFNPSAGHYSQKFVQRPCRFGAHWNHVENRVDTRYNMDFERQEVYRWADQGLIDHVTSTDASEPQKLKAGEPVSRLTSRAVMPFDATVGRGITHDVESRSNK